MGIRTIHYTQEQAREAVGVSAEKLRHWRKSVPYLRHKTGKSARFTFSDLLGLAVTLEIVGRLGVGVGAVGAGVSELFELLGRAELSRLGQTVAVVTSDEARLCAAGEVPWSQPGDAVLAVPCWPLIERLSGLLLPIPPEPQSAHPFPPQALRVNAR
ncbi:hypothetical protein FF100_28530 [Methylobacterium terricola]|uniref:MerR HTH family regulatory protein n=1 Tax=Methylobacterium terricola TaxID=2583531 RepID=A0A5C4L9N5_9HYPH|nr:hypothetical protein [Methylobacterium terricola]TNC08784.1 hypothetical protein FF100_28530 [Methylobacterium terricola]